MKKTLCLLSFAFVSISLFANNPFTYREAEQAQSFESVAPLPATDLSEEQRAIVLDLIIKAMEANSLKEGNSVQQIDGEPVLVLKDGQRHIGLSSGMHVIYDEGVRDYLFFDSKLYKKVVKGSEIEAMKENALNSIRGLISSPQNNTQQSNTVGAPIRPVSLSSQGN